MIYGCRSWVKVDADDIRDTQTNDSGCQPAVDGEYG